MVDLPFKTFKSTWNTFYMTPYLLPSQHMQMSPPHKGYVPWRVTNPIDSSLCYRKLLFYWSDSKKMGISYFETNKFCVNELMFSPFHFITFLLLLFISCTLCLATNFLNVNVDVNTFHRLQALNYTILELRTYIFHFISHN